MKTNLFLKKRGFQDIIRLIYIFIDPLNANLAYLNLRDTRKIDSPFLKVSRVKEFLEKEDLNKLKNFCITKGFNYNHILEHQNNISKS